MKDPIQKYFQVGTIQWMTHPPVNYPILDSVKTICCDEYFNALEITHIEDQETKDKVRDMLAQSHMKVCYGAQPRLLGPKLNPNDLDEEGRKKAEAVLMDSVDEARYMGAKGIASWQENGNRRQRTRHMPSCLRLPGLCAAMLQPRE